MFFLSAIISHKTEEIKNKIEINKLCLQVVDFSDVMGITATDGMENTCSGGSSSLLGLSFAYFTCIRRLKEFACCICVCRCVEISFMAASIIRLRWCVCAFSRDCLKIYVHSGETIHAIQTDTLQLGTYRRSSARGTSCRQMFHFAMSPPVIVVGHLCAHLRVRTHSWHTPESCNQMKSNFFTLVSSVSRNFSECAL